MPPFINTFEENNIYISYEYYGIEDLATGWEVKTILDNPQVFDGFFNSFPLDKVEEYDEYCLFLLTRKLSQMREFIPFLRKEEDRTALEKLVSAADRVLAKKLSGGAIKYINSHIIDLFDDDKPLYDLRNVTLDLIGQYQRGIQYCVFEFLCNNFGYLMIDRFELFGKVFEQHPYLFERIIPANSFEDVGFLRFDKIFDIWKYVLKKPKSNLKEIVEKKICLFHEKIIGVANNVDLDNVLQIERILRKYQLFLQDIGSQKANELNDYVESAEKILQEHMNKYGHKIEYEIPVN